jgi:HlyD family secretion protein
MSVKKRNLIIIIGIVVLIILVVVLNLRFKSKSGGEVETAAARLDTLVSKVSATGNLKSQDQVNIQAQVMGRIDKLYVKEGDVVKKGALLCLLDRSQYQANLTLAKANFDQQGRLLARADTLFQKKLIAQEQYEQAKTNFDVARAQLEQAQDQWEKTQITAPISGTIVKLNIEEGETVIIGTMNNLGTVMMTIADLSRMLAVVDVDESDITQLAPEQDATVTLDALPDSVFKGKVHTVGYMPIEAATSLVTGQQTTASFEVEIRLVDNSPLLRPGMTVSANIVTAQKSNVLVVPIQAVGRRKIKGRETQSVFVVTNGVVHLQPIETGSSSDTDIEIVGGIKEGDVVVTGPYKILSKLTDGARVTPQKGSAEGNPRRGNAPQRRVMMRFGG